MKTEGRPRAKDSRPDIVTLDRRSIAGAFATSGLVVKRAYDVYVEDESGKKYLDLTAGGTTAIGYAHPELSRRLTDQISRGYDHVDRMVGITEINSELADTVKRHVPKNLRDGKVVFGHSGSDVVEKSIRLARFSKNRPIVVSYYSAHHGANATALSASPTLREMGTNSLAQFFRLPGFAHMPFPDSYRPWSGDGSDVGEQSIAFFERLISTVYSPEVVAGVIVEPILSLGGNLVPPDGYFQRLSAICRDNDIPFIADEVLTGMGKTGRMLAIDHWGLQPDVVCLGKALGGPLPFTLLLAEKELADGWERRDYVGVSKDGYVLGCAAAIQIFKIIEKERLVENASRVGDYLAGRLADLKEEVGLAGDVRGKGLMMAMDIVKSEKGKEPDSAYARRVVQAARKRGVIVGITGPAGNVIRFLPALTITRNHVDTAVEALSEAFKAS